MSKTFLYNYNNMHMVVFKVYRIQKMSTEEMMREGLITFMRDY